MTDPSLTCANGGKPVDGFSDGNSYCCPGQNECIAHGQDFVKGFVVPVCLTGLPSSVELCRRENDNLLPVIQVGR